MPGQWWSNAQYFFYCSTLIFFFRLRAPSYFVNTETPEVSCVYILTSHLDSLHRVSGCSSIFFLRVWCCTIGRRGAASPHTLLASWRRWRRRTSRPRWASRSRSPRSSSTPSMSPSRWGSSQPETNRGYFWTFPIFEYLSSSRSTTRQRRWWTQALSERKPDFQRSLQRSVLQLLSLQRSVLPISSPLKELR